MSTIDAFATRQLHAMDDRRQQRRLIETAHAGRMAAQQGATFVSFADNDYLGLARHPETVAAAQEALAAHGNGAAASRLITGNHPLYAPLEQALAQQKGTEAALVFGSGYLANIGIIPALAGKNDLILADKLVHACIIDGARLSGATIRRFRHNDTIHARAILEEERPHFEQCLIVTESIFSMDGDRAPLERLSVLAREYRGWLMADDAHGIGFLPPSKNIAVDVWMGTLSKALGAYGGYACTSRAVADYLAASARSLIFTTGLPPATCAAACKALEILQREPQRAQRAHQHAQRVARALRLPAPDAAIVPWLLGSEEAALAASEALKAEGILATAIRPPTVPPGTSRIRFAFSADHTDAQVDLLIDVLARRSDAA